MSEPKDRDKPQGDPKDKPGAGRAGSAGSPGSIGKALGGDLDFEPDLLLDSLLDDVELNSARPPSSIPGPKLHEPSTRNYPDDEVTMVGRADLIGSDATPAVGVPVATRPPASVPARKAPEPIGTEEVDELFTNSEGAPDWEEQTTVMGEGSDEELRAAIKQAQDVSRAPTPSTPQAQPRVNTPSKVTTKSPAVAPKGPAPASSPRAAGPAAKPAPSGISNAHFSAVNNDSVVTSADSFLPPPPSLTVSEGLDEETRIFRPPPSAKGGPASTPLSSQPTRKPAAAGPDPNLRRTAPGGFKATPERPQGSPPSLASGDELDDETRIFRPALENTDSGPPPAPKPQRSPVVSRPAAAGAFRPQPEAARSRPPSLAVGDSDSETKMYRATRASEPATTRRRPPDLSVQESDSETRMFRAPVHEDEDDTSSTPTRRPDAPELMDDPFAAAVLQQPVTRRGEDSSPRATRRAALAPAALPSIEEPVVPRAPAVPSARPGARAPVSGRAPASAPAPRASDVPDMPTRRAPPGLDDALPSLQFSESSEDDGLESLPPAGGLKSTPPPRPSQPPQSWADERPAATHLAEQDQVEEWTQRAEWFEAEAHASTDPQAKARGLLVASELWALLGDTARAREVATEASALTRSQTMVARQVRCLSASEGDFKAVAAALELETRGAATPEGRVHAAYLSAEVHRLVLKDDATAKKKLELALRAQQDDPRAHLMKLGETLSKSNAPPRLRFPETLPELTQVNDDIARQRGLAAPGSEADTPALVFDEARRALAAHDRAAAAQAVKRLAEVEGVGASATWLAAALLGHEPGTRAQAIELLAELAERPDARLARRALATRALEQGDAAAVQKALAPGEAADTFQPGDRVALGALTGTDPALLEGSVLEIVRDDELRPLASAAIATAPNPEARPEVLSGSTQSQSALRLGRSLAQAPRAATAGRIDWLRPAYEAFKEAHPDHALGRALGLEFAASAQSHADVARALADWPKNGDEALRERDKQLAAALTYEIGASAENAETAYKAALEADPLCEPAVRAVLAKETGKPAADLLSNLATGLADAIRAPLLLVEAALRTGSAESDAYETLLRRATDADPRLLLSLRLGEEHARRRGDAEQLLHWIRVRRDASSDATEKALDLVREALLIAESDMELAASLIDDAIKARPSDLGLRELFERLGSGRDRAVWRETVAENAGAELKEQLLLEAAFEHERAADREAAARAAFAADAVRGSESARVLAERNAVSSSMSPRVSEALLERARGTEDRDEAGEIYQRLSEIDRARGDTASALLWQSAIIEKSPNNLTALRHIEHAFIATDRGDELEPVAANLAGLLGANESNAHARLAARLRIKAGSWLQARELAATSAKQEQPRLWALRLLSAIARAADDTEAALRADQRLLETLERPLDKATLSLRCAEASTRLGKLDEAKRLLERALELVPDHLVALSTLAEVLESAGDLRGAAKALEAAAEASGVTAHKVTAWHQAAVLWLDRVNESERGRLALEQAVALDIAHEDAVLRLQSLYISGGDRQKLAALLERRLEHTSDPDERIAIEVARGRALAEVGERDAAKAALAAALDANPDHIEALEAFAELCSSQGDWTGAEQAFIRLARHVIDPERQAQIYRKLGELYDTTLPNPQRAELAYREVLKREPADTATVQRLIQVYATLGDTATAVALQTELLTRAQTTEERRDRTLQLALVEEQINRDRRRAEAILEKARKDWPHDAQVLRAVAEFHSRGGDTRTSQVLIDRAATEARRALATGRFEPAFFEVLATVADLRQARDSALVAQATLAALQGQEIGVRGGGTAAGSANLDDLLAPDVLSPAFRTLLRKTGEVLDTAYSLDLRTLRATPLSGGSTAFVAYVQQVAEAFGIHGLEVFASPGLGPICMPLRSTPPQLVFGQALLDTEDDAARYFLMVRALKIMQAHASALSRTAPVELGPVLSAYIASFAPNFAPQGVDARKFADAKQRIAPHIQAKMDSDVPVLALEVIGAIGNRMSQVATGLHQWGNRTALLAIGDPLAALRSIALAGGHGAPPEGPERIKWIVRSPEARDLATYTVSDQYAEARARLGLGA